MIRRLLHWLTGHLRAKVYDAEVSETNPARKPLFERYLVCRLPGGGAVYLNHYLRADPDRGPHDHPWEWAVACPLAGGYLEERMAGWGFFGPTLKAHARRPGRPYRLSGADFHQIAALLGATSWSLFIHGPETKPWGFLRPDRLGDGCAIGDAYRYWVAAGPQTEDPAWWTEAPRGRDVERAVP